MGGAITVHLSLYCYLSERPLRETGKNYSSCHGERCRTILGMIAPEATRQTNPRTKKLLRYYRFLSILLLVSFSPSTSNSQVPFNPNPNAETNAKEEEPADTLGRSTPRGSVLGFLQAAQSEKYREAAKFLQLSNDERSTQGERIARELHTLMDKVFIGRVGRISDHREGAEQRGVPQDRERIGVFRLNDAETSVDLVRVSDPSAGDIWLFSSETLAAVPELYTQAETSEVESRLPRFLVTDRLLHTPVWRLIAFALLIPICFGLAWGIVWFLRAVLRMWMRWRHRPILEDVHDSLAAPATLILTAVFHQICTSFLGLALLFRAYYQRAVLATVVAGLAWLFFRVINRWGERARRKTLAGSGYKSGTFILLGQRILKAVVAILTVLAMFSVLGFNMTTALAGLGVGSIAVAFAAQKTLENLLGGVSVLGDEVIRVGETCNIGGKIGNVKDISLRSTRIRLLDRTELSVPNGELANMNVENLSRRDKHLFCTTLALRSETPPERLRALLADLRTLLRQHPKVDPNARVRFIGFGESSLDVEIFSFVITRQFDEFLALREELLLRVMQQVADSGVEFAFPSRTVYIAQEHGTDPQAHAFVRKAGQS